MKKQTSNLISWQVGLWYCRFLLALEVHSTSVFDPMLLRVDAKRSRPHTKHLTMPRTCSLRVARSYFFGNFAEVLIGERGLAVHNLLYSL